jgi:hypothetical protein
MFKNTFMCHFLQFTIYNLQFTINLFSMRNL